MTRWRHRIEQEGVEWLLIETIEAARRGKVVKEGLQQDHCRHHGHGKTVAYPTDSRLLERAWQLVKLTDTRNLPLRQNYNREAVVIASHIDTLVGTALLYRWPFELRDYFEHLYRYSS